MIPPVVDLAWSTGEGVVLVDSRWYPDGRSGRAAYEEGHLPGAVFVDLDRWLAGPGGPTTGRHPLPDPETFAEGLSLLGVADQATVVAYDDQGGVMAARLVWMLRVTGHQAALLDGGLAAYEGPLERGAREPERKPFGMRPWPAARLAGLEEALDPASTVLDARAPERFRGEQEPVDPRAGHIPGARSLPCRENLETSGRFLSPAALRRRFEAAGVTLETGTSVISYCGSGVTACHNLLAQELAGLGAGRLYPGSWSQYSNDASRPVETGDPQARPSKAASS